MLTSAIVASVFMVGDTAGSIEYISGYKPPQEWVYVFVSLAFVAIVFLRLVKLQTTIDRIRGEVTFTAVPSSYRINLPTQNEPPLKNDEFSIYITIQFEIWTDINIDTASLVLNVVGYRPFSPWWKFWELRRKRRLIGIRMEGQDSATYRKKIRHSDEQPFRDQATFRWRGKKDIIAWGDKCLFELVLKAGIPNTLWRTYIDPKLYERGLTTPL